MSNLWFSLKNSSPVRKARGSLWSVPRDRFFRNREQFEDAGRLSYSHPDISHSDLARLGGQRDRSKDDMSLVFTSHIPSAAEGNKCSMVVQSQLHSNEFRKEMVGKTAADSSVSLFFFFLSLSIFFFSLFLYQSQTFKR